MSRKGMPLKITVSSMTSLVVPGISVTMARSSLKRAFIREDFPTLVLPAKAVETP